MSNGVSERPARTDATAVNEKRSIMERAGEAGWIPLKHAAELVGLSPLSAQTLMPLPHRRLRRHLTGRPPCIVERRHVDRVVELVHEAKLSVEGAVRVVVAEHEGRL